MKTPGEYLDMLRSRYTLKSDSQAAALIGITRASASRYRLGEDSFNDATARRVAELLDLDPVEIVISAHYHRARLPEDRAIWSAALDRLAPYSPDRPGTPPMCIMLSRKGRPSGALFSHPLPLHSLYLSA